MTIDLTVWLHYNIVKPVKTHKMESTRKSSVETPPEQRDTEMSKSSKQVHTTQTNTATRSEPSASTPNKQKTDNPRVPTVVTCTSELSTSSPLEGSVYSLQHQAKGALTQYFGSTKRASSTPAYQAHYTMADGRVEFTNWVEKIDENTQTFIFGRKCVVNDSLAIAQCTLEAHKTVFDRLATETRKVVDANLAAKSLTNEEVEVLRKDGVSAISVEWYSVKYGSKGPKKFQLHSKPLYSQCNRTAPANDPKKTSTSNKKDRADPTRIPKFRRTVYLDDEPRIVYQNLTDCKNKALQVPLGQVLGEFDKEQLKGAIIMEATKQYLSKAEKDDLQKPFGEQVQIILAQKEIPNVGIHITN
jgi:hypothetical protein